jgi:hypothetical protein
VTAAAPVVRRAPAKPAAPARRRAKRHRTAQHATPMPTPTATATAGPAEFERIMPTAPRPAAVVRAQQDGGDGRRVAVAGLTLLGLALTSAGFLVLTLRDQRRSPRT